MNIRKYIGDELFKKATQGDAEAHYEIAMLMRAKGKIGFTIGALKEAAKYGHLRAKAMLAYLDTTKDWAFKNFNSKEEQSC